jgi:hypothetical protein
MTVRRMSRRDETGEKKKYWMVDVQFKHPDGRVQRIRKASPVQTKRGAEAYERELRAALLSGEYGREEEEKKEVPRLSDFADEFIETYAKSNNKPSEVDAKQSIFRSWLKPVLGTRRLDDIGVRDVEALKAKMLKKGLSAKRVNNTLTVLSRMLKYAVEVEILESIPRIKFVRCLPRSSTSSTSTSTHGCSRPPSKNLKCAQPSWWAVTRVCAPEKSGRSSGNVLTGSPGSSRWLRRSGVTNSAHRRAAASAWCR